jgi:pimeloyl-ACP methyl ester carboxylesterase
MGEHLDIGGHPTWVDQRGSGPATVILLHGGVSNSDLLLDAIGAPLAERHRLVAFDRRGHGYTADTSAPFHYEDMATETIGVLEAVVGGQLIWLVGATAASSACLSPCTGPSSSIAWC